MNEYFYDKEKHALLRIEFQTGTVHVVTVFGDAPEVAPPPAADHAPIVRKKGTCKKCGKPGHMQKTCPENQTHTFDSTKGKADARALTEEEFDYAKQAKQDGVSAVDVAKEIGVDVRELNRAFPAADYEWYVNHR